MKIVLYATTKSEGNLIPLTNVISAFPFIIEQFEQIGFWCNAALKSSYWHQNLLVYERQIDAGKR